jgi:hypothetical protein
VDTLPKTVVGAATCLFTGTPGTQDAKHGPDDEQDGDSEQES